MTETATAPAIGAGSTTLISLAPAAVKKLRAVLEQQGNPDDLFLRLGVKGGGCSGFSYVLEFDRDVDEKYDRRFEIEGIQVVVDRKSLLFLAGMTLDYTGDLHVLGEGGFEFRNPNAKRSCGCGTSFQA
jgi:iron-sulfur cluster assembly protein